MSRFGEIVELLMCGSCFRDYKDNVWRIEKDVVTVYDGSGSSVSSLTALMTAHEKTIEDDYQRWSARFSVDLTPKSHAPREGAEERLERAIGEFMLTGHVPDGYTVETTLEYTWKLVDDAGNETEVAE